LLFKGIVRPMMKNIFTRVIPNHLFILWSTKGK